MMNMVSVNGADASPVYEFLKYNSSLYSEAKKEVSPIPWNFAKFLVNPNGGSVFKYYGPKEKMETIIKDIETLLSGEAPKSTARQSTISLS
mmetsp:Transcript_35612/g.96590  ORF Transcript_35612/g.96590 Transcript_35612/m.96590 type:complete len:91 (-) Transcript_35612:67-339(-)